MSNLEDHDAEQADLTARCEAGTCGHAECAPQNTYQIGVAQSVRAYGFVNVTAPTADEAIAKVNVRYVIDNFQPHGGGSDDFDFTDPRDVYLSEIDLYEGEDDTMGDGYVEIYLPNPVIGLPYLSRADADLIRLALASLHDEGLTEGQEQARARLTADLDRQIAEVTA